MRVHSDEVLVFYGSVLSLLDVVLVWIFSLREYLANVWLVRGENRERERERKKFRSLVLGSRARWLQCQ